MKILGIQYKIKMFDDTHRGSGSMGFCDIKECEISINKDLTHDNKEATLLHEIIHSISDTLELELTEAQVCGIASGLFAVSKENNYNIDYFKKKNKKGYD